MKNKFLLTLFALAVAIAPATLMAQTARLGQHDAITGWTPSQGNFQNSDGQRIAQKIIDAVGLQSNMIIQAANVPNAAAVVYGGKRYILYNPTFITNLIRQTGTEWAAISVLAHEIGHHLNGHTVTGSGSDPNSELEADEFSGFILRKMGASLQDAQVAMKTLADTRTSSTHPGQSYRLASIEKGWYRADDQITGHTSVASTREIKIPDSEIPGRNGNISGNIYTRRASAPTSSATAVIGQVRFNADPYARYYITNSMNLVKLQNSQAFVIGKVANVNDRRFPYVIYDQSNTQLYVDYQGNIITPRGQQVGSMRAL